MGHHAALGHIFVGLSQGLFFFRGQRLVIDGGVPQGLSIHRKQLLKHLFSIDETAGLEILLRSGQGFMEGGAIHLVEPIAWIER